MRAPASITSQHSVLEALKRFPALNVLVVGDVMLDHYIRGTVARISPEAPVPVVEAMDDRYLPGGAANVACNLLALGARVAICGLVGADEAGERLRGLLGEMGAETSGLITEPGRPTTLKTRIVARSSSGAPQCLLRLDREVSQHAAAQTRAAVADHLRRATGAADAIIVSDYAKGVVDRTLVGELRRAGGERFIAVDPKLSHFDWYRGASIVTPNVREAEQASGIAIDGPEGLETAGARLLAQLGSPWLLITRGEEGMTLFRRGGPTTHIAAAAREVSDVTGAGDTVVATLVLGFAAGAGPKQAAQLANLAAGEVVGRAGTAVVSLERLRQLALAAGL